MKYTCKKWVLSQCYKIRRYVVNSILINISCIEVYKDNHFAVIEKKNKFHTHLQFLSVSF